MLKALELHGFKSFADKTRFDFPEGITVVVGPNGSGKSNVVDGIKWVLGAQSAKALRGKEMADVIFKGSSAGRKPAGTAEASIVFENADRTLGYDADEIRVTRRVYRSGEGEYLINGEACRLKDIKDLFRGTGVGTDAYSLIEQGRVGAMLQASGKERRAIFEEAAGISRFKAKKIETERRLARVEQNLLRLSDIVEEVERRLKAVRSQASKAQRYREHSTRLQDLRTQVGLVDWRDLTARLAALQQRSGKLGEQIAQRKGQANSQSQQLEQVEAKIAALEQSTRDAEQFRSGIREKIAGATAAATHHRRRQAELTADAEAHSLRLLATARRLTESQASVARLAEESATAQADLDRHRATQASCQRRVDELTGQLDDTTGKLADATTRQSELQLAREELTEAIRRHQSLATSAKQSAERHQARLDELAEKQQQHQAELSEQQQTHDGAQAAFTAAVERLNSADRVVDTTRAELTRLRERLTEQETQHVRLTERENLLTDLARRREGVSAAAKEALARARQPSPGPYADVVGLLADLIEVNAEAASVVEAALGQHAQYLVVSGARLQEHWQSGAEIPSGRVGLIPIEADQSQRLAWSEATLREFEKLPGVIGRADRFVDTADRYVPLIRRLLGQTWVIEDAGTARQIRQAFEAAPRLITLDGTIYECDGTIVVGPPSAATGLISRKSELRSIREELARLDAAIPDLAEAAAALEQRIAAAERERSQFEAEREAASQTAAAAKAQLESSQKTSQWLQQQAEQAQSELDSATNQRQQAEQAIVADEAKANQLAEQITAAEQESADIAEQRDRLAAQRQAAELQINTAQLETARAEQRTESLATQLGQLQADLDERSAEHAESRRRIERLRQQIDEEALAALRQTGLLAEWYLESDAHWRQTRDARRKRQTLGEQRAQLTRAIRDMQQELHGLEQQQHQIEVELNEVTHQRDHLAERMREDYGIDLASQSMTVVSETADSQDDAPLDANREQVDQEIADLRRKINNIGAVNLDALNELDDLEGRFTTLSSQFDDLSEAKSSLERIISRINTDSRRLFAETLEAIRVNFQQLYRKLFGGGHADLVLEEGIDVLESGIEIVANPPGKPAFSNSLLSGGEQGLTAVALLMAIFQHRPSPFCILDEVDAPLDESNIGRFVGVLREFLDSTKFVIVTHSKKTMTAANTLYGVTMQEPNVSKRVSVQFEDVSEDGEISAAAIARDTQHDSPDDDERGAA